MFFKILERLNSYKKFPYYFITPLVYTIGNASEAIHLAINKCKVEEKKLIIISTKFLCKFLKYKVCNPSLFNSLCINGVEQSKYKKIKFLTTFLVEIEFFFRRLIVLFSDRFLKIKFSETFRFPFIGVDELYRCDNINVHNCSQFSFENIKTFTIVNNNVDLEKRLLSICENLFLKNQLDKDQKIVTIHVRDGNYKSDFGRKDYRNSDINNYIEVIKFLIKNGFLVFRMGNVPMNDINFKDKKFIDYPHSELKKNFMDLYLLKKSTFFIGNQSGLIDTAYLFYRPALVTNMCELFTTAFPKTLKDRGIFKRIFWEKTNEEISIKEYASLPFKYHDPDISVENVNFKDNSQEELYEATLEMFNLIESNEDYQQTELQKKFNLFLKKKYEMLFNDRSKVNAHKLIDHFEALKFTRYMKSFKGTFCSSYLEKHFS